MKILFLDSAHPTLKKELEKNGIMCDEDFTSCKEEIEKKLASYNGIILRSRINIDKKFIDAFSPSPTGRAGVGPFVARVGAGMEHIDVAYAESKGVKCISSPEGNRNAVAEHALGMLLDLLNNISKANAEVKAGNWKREANRGTELEGKTIGIYGYGNTGRAFAKVLRGFDVKVLAYDKYKAVNSPLQGGVPFRDGGCVFESTPEEIFSQADIISLHLPLTEETKYLVNDSFISKLKKNIYLINTSRGPIVKTDDLVKNLKSGKILGVCLDVVEYEESSFEAVKPVANSQKPEALQYLLNSNKVVLTPHIAGWSFESSEKMAKILAEKILALTSK
jgi:D-3-phosphoglycerate dehydrogenase